MGEAEPLLRECLARSPALHDQGISNFYLGVIALAAGRQQKGWRLIKRGCLLHPEGIDAGENAKIMAASVLKVRELCA